MKRMRDAGCPFRYEPAAVDAARLLAVLGRRRLAALQAAFGGKRVWIPKAGSRLPCLACVSRDRCIRAWRREGRPAAEIARRLGLSLKTVYRVCPVRRGYSRPRRRRE
jgi:hypothetical protein